MKTLCRLLTPVLLAQALAACSSAPATPPGPRARAEAVNIKISATVEAVDLAARRITLKGPEGNSESYIAGPEVKRLAEIKVGDKITLDYKVAAVAELRTPTEEDKRTPVVLAAGSDRAPSDQPPGAAFARAVRVVALIESVDAAAQTFSLKGPLQGTVKVRVDDAAVFASLKAGQAIVVTFFETALLSVEPAPK